MKSASELREELNALEGQPPPDETSGGNQPPLDTALAERRAFFPGAQRRLADGLSRGQRHLNLMYAQRTDPSLISEKLAVMQIVRLMLDDDGVDGILYAAVNWNSRSNQSLADRMGSHVSNTECNPRWRLGMLPAEQRAYTRREAAAMKVPYVVPKPQPKLDAHVLVHMSSEQFAEFVIEFRRRLLNWDLKQYVYANLTTPAPQFFSEFVGMQKLADEAEEELFKGAMAAHVSATDPNLGEDEAQPFLKLLRWMGQRERLEAERRAGRIARQRTRDTKDDTASGLSAQLTADEKPSTLGEIDLKAVRQFYSMEIEKIEAEQKRLKKSLT